MANNGDFERLMGRVGLRYLTDDYNANYFGYIVRQFKITQPWWDSHFISSEQLFVMLAIQANQLLRHDGLFDLRVLGAINALALLVGIALVLRSSRDWPVAARLTLAGLVVLIGSDVAYVAYLNSIYGEPASLIGAVLVVGVSLLALRKAQPRPAPMVAYFAAAAVLTTAKAQNIPLGIVLAVWGARLFWRNGRWWRVAGLCLALGLAGFTLLMVDLIPPGMNQGNLYNAVFSGLLVVSPNPAADLSEIGLDPAWAAYTGHDYYEPGSPAQDPAFARVFYGRINYTRVLAFYAEHPARVWAAVELTAPKAFLTRPLNLGNYEADAGLAPHTLSRRFAAWSELRARVTPAGWALAGGVVLYGIVLSVLWIRGGPPLRRRWVELRGLIGILALAQFFIVLIGAGELDLIKQNILFNLLVDIGLIFDLAVLAGWAGRRARGLLALGRRDQPAPA